MKREILFRGKSTISKEWVYGDLVHTSQLTAIKEVNGDYFRPISVSPDTIGQYTGLKDKNGKQIFDGDIVHLKGDGYDGSKVGKDYYRVITFHEGSFCISIEDGVHFPVHTPICEYCGGCSIVNWVVIGNVTDNPELIK